MDVSAFQHMEKLLKEDTAREFEIQSILGRGGMAVVFLATEIKLGRKVAIKVLPPELTFGHGIERFMREAKTAALLDHPHIIPIYRIGGGGKIFWYAMKFLEGRSLDDVLKQKGKFTLDETIQILSQVADALDYAHDHKVIHRDMKPANVMLDSRNRVIVTDFGIAKALTEQTLTASGSVVGTPYYMSPEQGMGQPISGRADQYSVAVMAYRMLSGQFPFEGDSAIDILHKHCMMPVPPLESLVPGLPRHAYQAIHKALDKKADRRFSTVAGFVAALRAVTPELETSGETSTSAATVAMPSMAASRAATAASAAPMTPVTPPPRPSAPRPKPKSRRGVLVTAAVVLVAAGGVGGFLATRPGGTKTGGAPPQANQPLERSTQTAQVAPTAAQTNAAAALPESKPTAGAGQPATTGRVSVSGLPAGGTITVDGRVQRGKEFDVAAGKHEVRMSAAGYGAVSVSVTVAAGERMTVPFTGQRASRSETAASPAGTSAPAPARPATPTPRPASGARMAVVLMSIQPWAEVTIDDVKKGQQQRMADTLVPGTHLFHFERDGFMPIDTTLNLKPGETTRLAVQLKPR
jgi:predicted Ser/Thr protein kinase